MKLGQVFDPRNNALNAIRLLLASSVILSHTYPVTTGESGTISEGRQFAGFAGWWAVDAFFALSGFLVTSSWLRNPRLREYLIARALRILPGFYVCLFVTAFVIAPIAVAIQGGSGKKLLMSGAPIQYVLANSLVFIFQGNVGGTPSNVPLPGIWNSSLWTLIFEIGCYIAVAVIGVLGLANKKWVAPAIVAVAVAFSIVLVPQQMVATEAIVGQLAQSATRFAIMFALGAFLYQFRDAIPANWPLVAASVVAVLAASFVPSYGLVPGDIPLAYAVIVSGSLIHNRRLALHTDLSYGVYIYGFPMQQLLVICGFAGLNALFFTALAIAATLPVAAFSWFAVEKPAMSLKARLKRDPPPTVPEAGGEPGATAVTPEAN